MKKIFTLIIALVWATTMMAQMPSEMKFVGASNYSATIMGITAAGGYEQDTLVVSNISVANGCSDIAIPAMNVEIPNMFSKTIPAMTLTAIPFTMSNEGGMTITWAAESLSYTVMDGDEEKNVTITDLSGTYISASKTMSLTFNMQYGSMPGTITFTENDAVYLTTGIREVENGELKIENYKFIENGKVVIVKNGKRYNVSGVRG